MSRGSFKYKQKIHWKEKCKVVSGETAEGKTEIVLAGDNHGVSFKLIYKASGSKQLISMERFDSTDVEVNRFWLSFPTNESEHIYGGGETYSEFDLKGKKTRIWVAEHQNVARISKKLIKEKLFGKKPKRKMAFNKYESYYVQPTFVSSDKYFVHVDQMAL